MMFGSSAPGRQKRIAALERTIPDPGDNPPHADFPNKKRKLFLTIP